MSYVETARMALRYRLPNLDEELLDLYTLLTLVRGQDVTLKDVHDAWSVWRTRTQPGHRSAIPFEELSHEVQELDRKYAEAIREAAKDLAS